VKEMIQVKNTFLQNVPTSIQNSLEFLKNAIKHSNRKRTEGKEVVHVLWYANYKVMEKTPTDSQDTFLG